MRQHGYRCHLDPKGPMQSPPLTPRSRARSPFSPRSIYTAALAAVALVAGVVIPVTPLGGGEAANAATTTVTLASTESTFTTTRQPRTTHAQLPYVSATSSQDRTYVKFNGAALKGKKITSAKLVLQVATSSASKPGVVVHPASASWNEKTLTHANRPADSTSRLNTSVPQARAGQQIVVPLSNLKTLSTTGSFAFRVQYSQSAVGTTYVGAGAKAPRLVVTVQDVAKTTSTTSGKTAAPAATAPATTAPKASATTAPKTTTTAKASSSVSTKKVFAHYFPPYPLSLDNKPAASDYYARNYLTVNGENGIHAAYGGLLRDRPLPVGQSSSKTWQVDNLRTEIRQAKTAGIDGFAVNLMGVSGLNWTTAQNLFVAAEKEGFSVVPMVDGSAAISKLTPAQVAASLATLYKSPAAYKEGGQYLLSSFKAEGQTPTWWKQVISLLETKYGIPISFQAVFLAASDANMKAFSSISDSFGNWGERNPRVINKLPVYDDLAEKYGKDWIEPVAPQDMRPRSGVYAEAGNTEALRAGWQKAIRDGADYVQMVTWNDYSESSQFAPSVAHGSTFLEISRYYSDWFHTGTAPKITQDKLFLTHRTQLANATSTVKQKALLPTLSGSQGDVRNTAEALVFLTAPATVEITVAGVKTTYNAPAGVSAYTAPLKAGTVQAKIVRSGAAVKTAVSPYKVVATPTVLDLQYYAVTGK